jgi:hypothetical protein
MRKMPSLPLTKSEYSALPENKKRTADLIDKKQDEFIGKGNSKPGSKSKKDDGPKRLGLTMSGEQIKALNAIQDLYPKDVGRKKSISYQVYISRALTEKLLRDAETFGITVELTGDLS